MFLKSSIKLTFVTAGIIERELSMDKLQKQLPSIIKKAQNEAGALSGSPGGVRLLNTQLVKVEVSRPMRNEEGLTECAPYEIPH